MTTDEYYVQCRIDDNIFTEKLKLENAPCASLLNARDERTDALCRRCRHHDHYEEHQNLIL